MECSTSYFGNTFELVALFQPVELNFAEICPLVDVCIQSSRSSAFTRTYCPIVVFFYQRVILESNAFIIEKLSQPNSSTEN